MKNSFKFAAAAFCLALGVVHSQAQATNTNTLRLNLQTLNIALTGVAGGSTNGGGGTSFRVTTKDVIRATGVSSNSAAKLQFATAELVSSDGTTNEGTVVVVATGSSKNATFTDVSDFFLFGTNSALVAKGSTGNLISSFGFGVDTNGVALTNILGGPLTPFTFLVQGYTTIPKNKSFNSAVNGSGTSGDNPAVFKGTISASPPNNKTQIVTVVR